MLQSKRILLLPSLMLPLFLVLTVLRPSAQEAETAICHQSPVQTLFFYKPVENITMDWLIKNTDYFIFTKNDEKELAAVQAAGDTPVTQYIKFDAIHDPCFQAMNAPGTPCNCGRNPRNNQVAWLAEDVCYIRDNHPEWFMRGEAGELLYYQDDLMIDPGNREWREFWLSRVEEYHAEYGWDGIFVDNLATTFGVHSANFVSLQRYETKESYRDTVVDFFNEMRERYFDPKGLTVFANVSVYQGDLPVYLRYLEFLDGTMDEFWAFPRQDYYSVEGWEARLTRMEETLRRGKIALLVSQGEWDDHARMRFGLASYLLIANERAYFRYTRQGSYPRAWLYDDFELSLGEPLGAYTTDGTTWQRKFANGEVSVNPSDHSASIIVYDPNLECKS